MPQAIIFGAFLLLLARPAAAPTPLSQQPTPSQPHSQTNSSSGQQEPVAPQEIQAPKPCPASSDSSSGKPADCKSATKRNKQHRTPPASSSDTGPTKTVVRNGSTPEPTVAISGLSNQEALRELNTTNQLLADTDANLKQIAGRRLSAEQEDTVKEIKVYMEQARNAAKSGEVQRAYNLANKANMLSADLMGVRR
jgi:hypothetical protein